MGEDSACYSKKIQPISFKNVHVIINLPTKRISVTADSKHFSEYYRQDGGENQLA